MDAITLLKNDHRTVEQLFKRFEQAGDRAYAEKRKIVDRFVEALAIHAAIEEQLFYPVVRATVPGTEDITLESLEEHHIVKWVLSELDHMAPEDERFDAKVTVLIENVRHHVKEEENNLFPRVRDVLGRNALSDLGDAMVEARKTAPTHPHPRSPDTPPGNVVTGAAAGVADRIGDTVSGLAQGSVTAIGDLVALVLRRKKPRRAPLGSSSTRRTATAVRGAASDATQATIESIRRAKVTVERTGGTARATTSSAAAGARRTARTAKRGATSTARAAEANARSTARTAKANVQSTATAARTSARRTAATATRTTSPARATAKRTAVSAKGSATSARTAAKRTAATANGHTSPARASASRTATTAKQSATSGRSSR
jgi:hemerythrin superfamily protein